MRQAKRFFLLLIPVAAVALDHRVKAWTEQNLALYEVKPLIPGLFGLTHIQNDGAAYGILSGLRWPLVGATILALLFAVYALWRGLIRHPLGLVSLAGLAGGAIGNMIDRIRQGYVVDMLDFHFTDFFLFNFVFNVADVFVVCFGVLFCVYWIRFHETAAVKDDGEVSP